MLLTLLPSGWQLEVPPGRTLLEAADAAGIRLPRSCRNGSCRECRCRLVGGQVRYRVEWPGLSADEREEGWVLPCVALPVGDVVLLQPGARRMATETPPDAAPTGRPGCGPSP